ncbi:MAG TPA: AMP-binding protein, partial [Luteimonas sp.]
MSRPLESRTLGQLVEHAADALGAREALVFGQQRHSYERVRTDVRAVARGLMALGIEPGEHVMMVMPNSMEWVYAFYAIAKLGAVAVPINTRFRTVDLEYVLRQSDATTLLVVREFGGLDYVAMVRELVPEIDGPSRTITSARFPKLRRVVVIDKQAPPGAHAWNALVRSGGSVSEAALTEREARVDPQAPALMLYTSGTTGSPKGALHNHAWIRTVADGANRLGFSSRDSILLFVPLFHSLGLFLGGVLFLVSGSRMVLTERFDPQRALEEIERERITLLFGFDTHYFDMLEHADLRQRDLSSLRLAFLPAGTVGVEPTAKRVNREMCRSFSGYGSSEGGTAISTSFLDAPERERCLS